VSKLGCGYCGDGQNLHTGRCPRCGKNRNVKGRCG